MLCTHELASLEDTTAIEARLQEIQWPRCNLLKPFLFSFIWSALVKPPKSLESPQSRGKSATAISYRYTSHCSSRFSWLWEEANINPNLLSLASFSASNANGLAIYWASSFQGTVVCSTGCNIVFDYTIIWCNVWQPRAWSLENSLASAIPRYIFCR